MESTNAPDSAQPSPDTGGLSGSASATASVSISNASTGTSTPSIPNIEPNQAAQLAQRFTNEIELAKAAGSDVEKAKQHYQKAESIKRILISYRAQKKAKQDAANSSANADSNTNSNGNSNSNSSTNLNSSLTNNPSNPTTSNDSNASSASKSISAVQSPASAIQSPVPVPSVASLADTSSQLPQVSRPQTPSEINTKAVTIDLFNQVRSSLQDLLKKIQVLEDSKTAETDPTRIESTNTELAKLKPKVSQYQKIAVYMKNQLIQQGKLSANGGPLSQAMSSQPSPSPVNSTRPSTGENTPVVQPLTSKTDSKPEISNSKLSNDSKFVAPASSDQPGAQSGVQSSSFVAARTGPLGSLTNPIDSSTQRPQPFTATSSYSALGRAAIPTSTSAANLRTTSSFVSRPGIGNGIRPGLGMHSATDFNSYSTLSSIHSNTSSNFSDNGGRVLTKRKLVDLVNNIGMDEGDAKTTMDNDVEEILLDLADEFISSVTGFACQIAKHRKVDKVDIRDFQLHLERNWGIKVPDFSLDETKSVRKWTPSADYAAKVSEIESAQSNGNETSKVDFSSKK
ncbi:TFIID subunit (TBP-associated factor) [Scheffersomyces stipitis CBS 6054]|uniref:TBP-associated factor 12 n=1 Tax=Scheffersomyces stipitis (strain ATCC 58785 / CBS 6054 / NBRC 10063 / NRRL Y-11545) TaxID=322104 RepID=A3LQ65_PICST|nr:TFIID subunit (TBP-associated factor) [Scheffersomyces stipitis CBS 6054]ABN65157.2 TFIID subunit (TBP-associated factor) [Scheffersomyces stipitis CBS 6054]KAG2736923.1 hypothetical protein G9P44_001013 [Scheffersomyces stipitis]